MNVAIIAITEQGKKTARILEKKIPGATFIDSREGVKSTIEGLWHRYDGLVCIMAAGIVVRCIANLCHSKLSDPAVVVLDERGDHAISLLSGHVGGGNDLARLVSAACGAQAVITTGSDVAGHTSVDLWTVENNLNVLNPETLSVVSLKLLNTGFLEIYMEDEIVVDLPGDLKTVESPESADIVISLRPVDVENVLFLMPRCHFIGFGCRRGARVEEFQQALDDICESTTIDLRSVAGLGTIDLKRDEEGLLEIANRHNWPISFYSSTELNAVCSERKSEIVFKKIGAFGVCEPSAMLASRRNNRLGRLITGKMKWKKITAAVARVAG